MKNLATILKENKLKATPQRLAIYQHLYDSTAHPTADEIHTNIKSTNPTMSLATVYKTIEALKQHSLIIELHTNSEKTRYDANIKPHPHFICKKCGKVYDIHTKALETFKNQVQNENNFIIDSEKVYFYGTCKDCK